ncbi:class I SAM-dependent methyltransferase [Novipirellula galeiformis]|nr:class I SAM-dependent methyltransferase [Novipirellula galeiformis]
MIQAIVKKVQLKLRGLEHASMIHTHMLEDEKETLYTLARKSRGNIVEVGSYLGASSCYLAAGLSKHKHAKLTCVDTWNNDAMTEGLRDTYDEFRSNTSKYGALIQPLRGTSQEIASSFTDTIDLLFLDADHEYAGVKTDWDAWSPHLAQNATVIFHDIGWAEGVQQVVREDVHPIALEESRLPNLYWARLRQR